MNMKQLKYVIVLSEEGSFSRAAERLDISQPSLSQYLKKIEEKLGIELFERTNGYVRLTDAGKVYVDAGRKILEIEHNMYNQISDISECKVGSVIVGTTPFRSATMMPDIVAEFKKKYPGMHIVVDERGTEQLREGLEKGEFDFCITTSPIDDRMFESELIYKEEVMLAVLRDSKSGRNIKGKSVGTEGESFNCIDVKAIDGAEFVMITDNQIMQKMLHEIVQQYDLKIKTSAVVKSIEAQIEMVRQGVGMALVPRGILKIGMLDKSIDFYRLKQNVRAREVILVYRKGQYLSKTVKDLIQIIKEAKW